MAVEPSAGSGASLKLFLSGDVMTGRGIDQVLAQPSDPVLYEDYITDARDYVRLAERASGPIKAPVTAEYVWGDALAEIDGFAPQLRIVNLETAVTTCADAWAGKGIHYRMHPTNVGCLTAARIDGCVLANNHVLDWGHEGLIETLQVLQAAGLRTAGAGIDEAQATAPAIFDLPDGRLLLFAAASETSGVPRSWRAGGKLPGVCLLGGLDPREAEALAARIDAVRRPGDTVVVSLHWGGNWGYEIADDERVFARTLIDAGVDLVHGHSSHHARAFEVHRGRLILYGCGDFINDYEGIGGHESLRGDLSVAYFVELAAGRLRRLTLLPFIAQRFRLRRARPGDVAWLAETLNRECARFDLRLTANDRALTLAV